MSQEHFKLTQHKQLEELYPNIDKHNNNTLLLSANIRYLHFDKEWEIIQFICSWAKKHDSCSIKLFKQTKISKFRDDLLLIAFYITDKTLLGKEDKRNFFLGEFRDYVLLMNGELKEFVQNARGRQLTFLCLGGAKNEFLHHFYSDNNIEHKKVLKTEGQIKNFIANVLKGLKLENVFKSNLNSITQCAYEFFSNTDKHGRTDNQHNPIKKSIRAMSAQAFDFSSSDKKIAEMKSRYRNVLKSRSKILSLTIFDNGEGVIKRYTELTSDKQENDLTFEERKKIFSEVFKDGTTSSSINNSGKGLYNAQQAIKELHGAYLINTNSVELFYSPNEEDEYEEEYKEIPSREGTLITIVIPY